MTTVHKGVSEKTLFQENQKLNPQSISLGVSLKESKMIFDIDTSGVPLATSVLTKGASLGVLS